MNTTQTSNTLLLRVTDAAQILGFGRSTIYELCDRGEIDSIKEGKARRIVRTSLDAYVARKVAEVKTEAA
jgi:excisionase family DNA binding protein